MLQYLEALLQGKGRRAEEIVAGSAAGGVPVAELYQDVLAPAQNEIGRLWHAGEISVADEHFATSITESAMAMLRRASPAAAPRGRRVVASSVAGDLHAIGVRMVADFFEMDGWEAIYLGANTPAADVVETLREHGAHLLAAGASSFLLLRAMIDLVHAVRADERLARVPVIVGGAPFLAIPGLWRDVGADGSAPTAPEAVALGNRLIQERAPAG
jgi:methanogenic corrinoid protein MtbC1